MWMQKQLGWILLKHRKKNGCVPWGVTCQQLGFPQWRFPTELQKHVRYLPSLSWAASRVSTLRCLNLQSAGVQTQNTLVTRLPAVSPVSPTKEKKKTNQVKWFSIYKPTNLIAKIKLYVNYNVLIINSFVQLPIFFSFSFSVCNFHGRLI